jgi:hypothetical protein
MWAANSQPKWDFLRMGRTVTLPFARFKGEGGLGKGDAPTAAAWTARRLQLHSRLYSVGNCNNKLSRGAER